MTKGWANCRQLWTNCRHKLTDRGLISAQKRSGTAPRRQFIAVGAMAPSGPHCNEFGLPWPLYFGKIEVLLYFGPLIKISGPNVSRSDLAKFVSFDLNSSLGSHQATSHERLATISSYIFLFSKYLLRVPVSKSEPFFKNSSNA